MTTQPVDARPPRGDYALDADGPEDLDDIEDAAGTEGAEDAEATATVSDALASTVRLGSGLRVGHEYQEAPQFDSGVGYLGQGTATDMVRTVRRLTARVEWLEEQLRASGTIPVADLDSADDALLDLADAVLNGRDAEEKLLEPSARAALQAAVDRFARLEQDREQATGEVLAISAAVESSARTDPVHVHHLSRFATAEQQLAVATAAVADHAPSARASKKRLAEDDEMRAALAETIAAGIKAEAALNTRLRTRIAGEASRGALMPSWFSAALGPAPARAAAVWFDLAVRSLAYRFIYDVTDTGSLLGPEPAAAAPKHQRSSHDRLGTSIDSSGL